MNKLIFRKLSWDILTFFMVASLGITLIVWVIQAVNFLEVVSEQGHSLKVYFVYTSLNLPKIFSRLLIFIFFISTFYIINKYEENNEILVFWTNGIKKIKFINFILKFSLFFVLLQFLLNFYLVPYSQNLGQMYLKNSSVDFYPKLIAEKKFTNVVKNLTMFIDKYNQNGVLEGIFIKERINKDESKIIIANKGKIIKYNDGFKIKLLNGGITNINSDKIYNLNFNETEYDLSKFTSRTRKYQKLQETDSLILLSCLKMYYYERKKDNVNCKNIVFPLKEVYEEIFQRLINPIYIFFIGLMASSLVIRPKSNKYLKYFKVNIFLSGFLVIILSQISFRFIFKSPIIEFSIIFLPIILVLFYYIFLLLKTKFKLNSL